MNVYEKAIEKWGVIAQLIMTMEECAELIQACSKVIRATNAGGDVGECLNNLAEELTDVEIMVEQMKTMLPSEVTKYWMKEKMVSLRKRLN